MDEEPGHKAMLYFLEVLMNSNGPLTISQLAGRFGSRNFTPEMRQAAGGNEVGLKKFMLKYPSLFTVTGNMVSLCDGGSSNNNINGREESPSSTSSVRSLPDVSTEMEAVAFFKNKLLKKGEKWVQIKSLAGHLSQASAEIRNVVGPQVDFKKWVLRHPHIFEVQGELVGLRDGDESITTPNLARHALEMSNGHNFNFDRQPRPVPPKTPPSTRKAPPKTPPPMRRSRSFGERSAPPRPVSFHEVPQQITPPKKKDTPVTMTANEYKALTFLKEILEKRGSLKLHNITGHFSQAPEGVRNTIGWTKMELEEFLKKHQNVFTVSDDELVSVIKNAKLNVVITGSRPQGSTNRTLTGRKGKIFHVAKLWGIIDLGKHEHVFFDKSIMKKPIDDLQKEYRVGETLYFNAVLALKTSRAKWRAVEVWKENERRDGHDIQIEDNEADYVVSPCPSIEEEINKYLPQQDSTKENTDTFVDAAPSGAGVVSVWNYSEDDDVPQTPTGKPGGLTMVPESFYMINSTVSDLGKNSDGISPPILTGAMRKAAVESAYGVKIPIEPRPVLMKKKTTTEVACQTVSTGDIIATQLYYETK